MKQKVSYVIVCIFFILVGCEDRYDIDTISGQSTPEEVVEKYYESLGLKNKKTFMECWYPNEINQMIAEGYFNNYHAMVDFSEAFVKEYPDSNWGEYVVNEQPGLAIDLIPTESIDQWISDQDLELTVIEGEERYSYRDPIRNFANYIYNIVWYQGKYFYEIKYEFDKNEYNKIPPLMNCYTETIREMMSELDRSKYTIAELKKLSLDKLALKSKYIIDK